MPQPQFRASLEDRDRQHVLWHRNQKTILESISLSSVCGDHMLEFHVYSRNEAEHERKSHYLLHVIFRNPINGGGNMTYGFWAMRELFRAFCEPDRELQLSFFYDLPQHTEQRSVLRHLDQSFGHILIMEEAGAISIALIPHERNHNMMNDGESICMVFNRHDTPPRIYRCLQYFLEGVERDNRERPHFYGNHA